MNEQIIKVSITKACLKSNRMENLSLNLIPLSKFCSSSEFSSIFFLLPFQHAIWTQCTESNKHHHSAAFSFIIEHKCIEVQLVSTKSQRQLREDTFDDKFRGGKFTDRTQQLPKDSREATFSEYLFMFWWTSNRRFHKTLILSLDGKLN